MGRRKRPFNSSRSNLEIKAFETPVGMGLGYIEPIPPFHPPSLKPIEEPKPTKLMQRLLKQSEREFEKFRNTLLLKQTKTVMPMVQTVQVDQTPLNLPPLFASKNKTRKPVKYIRNKIRPQGK